MARDAMRVGDGGGARRTRCGWLRPPASLGAMSLALAALCFLIARHAMAGDLYWDGNGAAAGVGGPTSGAVNWLGGNNWSTSAAGTDAAQWINGGNALFANQISSFFPPRGAFVHPTAVKPLLLPPLHFLGAVGA